MGTMTDDNWPPPTIAKDFQLAHAQAGSDGSGVAIYIRGARPLPPEVEKVARKYGSDIVTAVEEAKARLDPETEIVAKCVQAWLLACFADAGLTPVFSESVPNEYWPDARDRLRSPWLLVTTRLGHVKIGWRKSVIQIDWSRTVVEANGRELFPETKNTVGDRHVHAWSLPEAAEMLRRLAQAAGLRSTPSPRST